MAPCPFALSRPSVRPTVRCELDGLGLVERARRRVQRPHTAGCRCRRARRHGGPSLRVGKGSIAQHDAGPSFQGPGVTPLQGGRRLASRGTGSRRAAAGTSSSLQVPHGHGLEGLSSSTTRVAPRSHSSRADDFLALKMPSPLQERDRGLHWNALPMVDRHELYAASAALRYDEVKAPLVQAVDPSPICGRPVALRGGLDPVVPRGGQGIEVQGLDVRPWSA